LAWTGVVGLAWAIMYTISAVYYVREAGMNPLQLMLVGTVLEGTIFVFEIPTGVIADTYSRRLSVIIGSVLFGLSALLQGLVPVFGLILVAEGIRGLGWTFVSGALDAWVADEVGAEHVGPLYQRAAQIDRGAWVVGALAGAGIATFRLSLPIVLSGIALLLLAFFLIAVMQETGFQPTPASERGSWGDMAATFREGIGLVRLKPVLITFLLIAAFWGMASEGADRLWENHFLDNLTLPAIGGLAPVVWFGIIGAVSKLLGIATTEIVSRRVDLEDQTRVSRALALTTGLWIVAVAVFAWAGGFVAGIAAYLCMGIFRMAGEPLQQTWLVQHTESKVRATVLSLNSQCNALGQVAGGPAVGAVGTVWGLRAALSIAAAALLPAIPLFSRAGRQGAAQEAAAVADP
jgi:DHA3 family tetracycline resistance protein-like MFS transporter